MPKMICYDECEFCSSYPTCEGRRIGKNAVPLDYEHELDRK
jgi:hypothetical protein